MSTSLISLYERGENLGQVHAPKLHYPDTGAEPLSIAEEKHFWFTFRRDLVVRMLKSSGLSTDTNALGLDIGCGTGYTAVALTELGFRIYGVDVYDSFNHFKKSGRGAGFIQGDIFSIDPVAEFDFVTLLDVIEHIEDDAGFLEQSLRFLKPGGVAVISVPAFRALWSKVDDDARHLRRYTKMSMGVLMRKLKPPIRLEEQTYYYGSTLIPYALSRLRKKQGVLAEELRIHPFINHVMGLHLKAENLLLPAGGLPFGSSLFTLIRKL